ncbi:DUF2563 family protein [Nocardia brasiliensis]
MYADLDRLVRGSSHTDAAADNVGNARKQLLSAQVTTDMFGGTEIAASAELVVARVHEQHVTALDDHHRDLTDIGARTIEVVHAFGETDRTAAAVLGRTHASDVPM